MINISELIQDPDFCQTFTVVRTTGHWSTGGIWVNESTEFDLTGVLDPENTKELNQIPEGDQVTGGLTIFTDVPLFTTQQLQTTNDDGYISDEVIWMGQNWKINNTYNYIDFGYFKSEAVRKMGS